MPPLLEFLRTDRVPQWTHSRLGLLPAYPRSQASNNVQPAGFALLKSISSRHDFRFHHHGSEEVGSVSHNRAVEAALGHPDNCERVTVYEDRLVQQAAICAKPPLSIIEAEHRDRVRVRNVIIRLHQQSP